MMSTLRMLFWSEAPTGNIAKEKTLILYLRVHRREQASLVFLFSASVPPSIIFKFA